MLGLNLICLLDDLCADASSVSSVFLIRVVVFCLWKVIVVMERVRLPYGLISV